MAGSGSSVHGEHHGENEVAVTRVELKQLQNNMLQAMERMLNERLPGRGNGVPQRQNLIDSHGEASVEYSVEAVVNRGHEDEFSNYGGDHWEVDGVGATTRGRHAAARGMQRGGHDGGRGHGPRGRHFDPHEHAVMVLMTMMVSHIVVLLHMVMMVVVMTVAKDD